jgi:uncharacterized membrane protein
LLEPTTRGHPKGDHHNMKSKARLLGHPIHPMLIAFPLGLFPVAVIFDLIFLKTGTSHWADVAFWLITGGLIGGLAAALFGVIDWWAIPAGTRAKQIGLWHGCINVLVTGLFAISWWMRHETPTNPGRVPIYLGIVALLLALVAAWLGGELIYRLNVGVDDGANLNAPSSLSEEDPTR